ncbi:altered inheritance of mitochondria protein 21 [Aspergillus bertholletiae]|uniref:Altered inheritance of mitochondria protein 21 n=1 Tax=Aspergillus bertholletiae TaxID=1226010 RepID=A0A5N7BLD5_9EURO|nr:altered inheritance of mitochondria protein 21 [Aspergillus bertholletiae]
MTTQSPPIIPPRPSRSPNQQGLAPADVPKIPARPVRRFDRSVSPLRDTYAPSPLNEPPNGSSLSRSISQDVPQRPPSVTIPSLGEEGNEYEALNMADVPDSHREGHHSIPAEMRNVGSDLKLHAPRPSLPSSSAKAQVQAVTRTDSRQAAAAGLGGTSPPTPDDHHERPTRSLQSRTSYSRADSSTSIDRRQSMNGEEHGIRVPMYPNAGDVQAPSPSPYHLEQNSGQRAGRSHNRTRSGREASLPPGSYGLHGHGVQPNDKFEKAWYEKHPEEFAKEEQGQYGPGVGSPRPDWALSSDDLNKIVRGSAVTGSGLGTSPAVVGTPEEEVGYIAADEYTHRLSSPPPESRRGSRLVAESPLRKESVPSTETEDQQQTASKDTAHKSEEPGVIHVDEPYHQLHHPDGFAQTPGPEELSGKHGEGDVDEDEPILAADEVRPESAFQHPAVSPTFDRRESMEADRSHTPSVSHSRSNSRTAGHRNSLPTLARYNSRDEREDTHTPLEDVEEYEPLFPEDDSAEKKPLSTTDRFKKRPDLLKHRFPSQDIWEDSPNSLQLHTTVSTPDIPQNENFETPEQESFRRSQVSHVDPHKVASQILQSEEHPDEKPLSRPDIAKQRFPSKDIWEDAPESQKLVTTIEPAEEGEVKSPDVPTKPNIPSRPQKRPQQSPPVDASTKPVTSPTEKRQPPSIPDRPKPQIPTRPAKPVFPGAGGESKDAVAKPKPAVPARPGGSKIAALKAGFLSDLNSRLQLGPQVPPKPQEKKAEEPPAEKVPLSDARKGRARGPARRRPAAEIVAAKLPTISEIRITEIWNVWEVNEAGNLVIGNEKPVDKKEVATPDTISSENHTVASPIAKDTTSESVDPQPIVSPKEDPISPGDSTLAENQPPPSTEAASTVTNPLDEEEPAIVPTAKRDEPEASSEAVSAENDADKTPSTSSADSGVDDVAEVAAAAADGKRPSEGN